MCRCGRVPPFFPLGDLLLEGGRESVAEEESALLEGDRLAACEGESGRCLVGRCFEFPGKSDGLLGQ